MQQNEGIGTFPAISINFLTEPIDFENNRVGAMGDHRIVVVGKGDSLDAEEENPYHIASVLNAYIDDAAFPNWLFQLDQGNLDCFVCNLEQIQNSFIQETNGILFPKINTGKVFCWINRWNLERAFPLPAELACKILLNLTHPEDIKRARLVCRQFNEEIVDGYYFRLRRYIDLMETLDGLQLNFLGCPTEFPIAKYRDFLKGQDPTPKELFLTVEEIRSLLIDWLAVRFAFMNYLKKVNITCQYPELEDIMAAANLVVVGTICCNTKIESSDMLDDHLEVNVRTFPYCETPVRIKQIATLKNSTEWKIDQFIGKKEGDIILFHLSEGDSNIQIKLKCRLFGHNRWKMGVYIRFEDFITDILVDKINYCSNHGLSDKEDSYNKMLIEHQKKTN